MAGGLAQWLLWALVNVAEPATDQTQWMCSHTASDLGGSSLNVAVYVTASEEVLRSVSWTPARIANPPGKGHPAEGDPDLSIHFDNADQNGLGAASSVTVSALSLRPAKWLENARATLKLAEGGAYVAEVGRTFKAADHVFYSGTFRETEATQAANGDFATRLEAASGAVVTMEDAKGRPRFRATYLFLPQKKHEALYRKALTKVEEKLKTPTACDRTVDDPSVEYSGPVYR
jgi:hypothetical protein